MPKGALRAALLTCLLLQQLAWSQERESTLPPVEVKARRMPISTFNNVTVITAEDIAKSPASNLTELLANEANVAVQSFFGGDKWSSIDIRGMGDTSVSNVLVIVDGERLNALDQSGPDLSTLTLAQIERIEVVRGGGSVQYGPGAVGGVIHITTRRPQAGLVKGRIGLGVASFNTRVAQASIEGGKDFLAARLQASHNATDGHRDNTQYWSNKVSGEVRLSPEIPGGTLDAYVRGALSKDRYGMPGGLPRAVLDGTWNERSRTREPISHGAVDDTRLGAGLAFDWDRWGRLSLSYTNRERVNPYLPRFEPVVGIPIEQQIEWNMWQSELASQEWHATHQWTTTLKGLPQTLEVGTHLTEGSYRRAENDIQDPSIERRGQVTGRASHMDARLSPWQGMLTRVGLRWDSMRVRQQTRQFGDTLAEDKRWGQRSSELGWSWQATPEWEPFVGISRHIRQPNLDDLALAAPDLRPQHGRTREAGVRYKPAPGFQASVNVFDMRIADEIYYGFTPGTFTEINQNYPWTTRRQGAEADIKWQALPSLRLRGQLAYVKPRFEEIDADIPLVARQTWTAGVQWRIAPGVEWGTNVRHSGKTYDGSDWANVLPRLRAYTVVDTLLRLETRPAQHKLTWTFGIQNLFEEVYATKSYRQDVYPMPGRRFSLNMVYEN